MHTPALGNDRNACSSVTLTKSPLRKQLPLSLPCRSILRWRVSRFSEGVSEPTFPCHRGAAGACPMPWPGWPAGRLQGNKDTRPPFRGPGRATRKGAAPPREAHWPRCGRSAWPVGGRPGGQPTTPSRIRVPSAPCCAPGLPVCIQDATFPST